MATSEHDQFEGIAPATVEAIRRDERHRLADLLIDNEGTIVGFASNSVSALRAIAFLLRLDQ